ncbi:hypothetical protein JB92DRAFT_3104768 [Gautieria morchelliformis]|nr:hypothetical protein JB92DRAFT_3104768 [Gautieria morchelliformis]
MTDNDEKSWGHSDSQTTKHPATIKPKTSRPGTSRKQAVNQTLSCAECRRLKLRCDRVFPCGSCQKRGIAELCPEGSLPTRNKPVASSTDKEQLYQRISELRGRVQELESALETVHASVSSEPHPLLSEESYMRKSSRRRKTLNGQGDEDEHDESEEGENLDEALGSLNVGGDGQTRYFGRSACVERLFKYQNNSALNATSEANILVSAEVAMIYQSFPFLTIGEATNLVQERIWRHLPPLQRAQALRRSYCRQVYYTTDVVPQDGWFEDLFSRIYKGTQPTDTPLASFSESGVRIDELALIFAYFAMAALVDLDLTPFNYEAEAYACLSRSALTSMNVLKNATIITIETLVSLCPLLVYLFEKRRHKVLLGYFEAMWGEIIGSGDAWIITALATKLAQVIGLHRNTMKFGLEPIDVKRRNKVYWEVYTLELVECLSHGRPSTFSLVPSDVAMPVYPDSKKNIHTFRYRLAAECLAPLSKQAFALKMPVYTSVIELDRKIRKLCDSFGIGVSGQNTFNGLSESEAMQNYMKLVYRESIQALLYLHRTFFARAVVTNPSDPQHTKYGLSVSGAYDSAMTLVQALGDLFQYYPASSSRALLCWNHTLCSVFILGSISSRCPGSRLAPLAAKRLHDIDELYQRASTYGGRASADGPIVSRMTEKSHSATQIYAMEHNRTPRGLMKTNATSGNHVGKRDPDEDGDDELALLGGYTRVVQAPKDSISPGSSTGLAQSGYSPVNRNVSPETPGSLPETGLTIADPPPHWEMPHSAILEYQRLARNDDQGSSPSVDTTDLHLSSGGSASSGMSPVPSAVIPIPHEPFMHNGTPLKSFEAPQGEMDMQYRGVPGYEYSNGIPDQALGIGRYDGDVVRIGRHPGLYQGPGHNGAQQHVDYVPMDISTAPESQDWNFLDDWYGHVFQLDVIPPDYGKTTTSK